MQDASITFDLLGARLELIASSWMCHTPSRRCKNCAANLQARATPKKGSLVEHRAASKAGYITHFNSSHFFAAVSTRMAPLKESNSSAASRASAPHGWLLPAVQPWLKDGTKSFSQPWDAATGARGESARPCRAPASGSGPRAHFGFRTWACP